MAATLTLTLPLPLSSGRTGGVPLATGGGGGAAAGRLSAPCTWDSYLLRVGEGARLRIKARVRDRVRYIRVGLGLVPLSPVPD